MFSKKKALLIGINYVEESTPKHASHDALELKTQLMEAYGYQEKDIVVMADDEVAKPPTRENIILESKKLVEDARPGDHFLLHFSGHGLHNNFGQDIQSQFNDLPQQCSLTAIFDSFNPSPPFWNYINSSPSIPSPGFGLDSGLNDVLSSVQVDLHEKQPGRVASSPYENVQPLIPGPHVHSRPNHFLSSIKTELCKTRWESHRAGRNLMKAITAGGAGGLFLGSPWICASQDEGTALSNAVEALNYAISLNPASIILPLASDITKMAEAMEGRNKQRHQTFRLVQTIVTLAQEVTLNGPAISAFSGGDTLLVVEELLQDVRKFLERIVKRRFIESWLFSTSDNQAYDNFRQRLHIVYGRISDLGISEKRTARGLVAQNDLNALLRRLKHSRHIVACTSVALSFIAQRNESGFDDISFRLLEAMMKDIRAFASPASSTAASIAQVPLNYNKTLFDEPCLRALISTFDEASRCVMEAAANKAREKVLMTSIFIRTDDAQVSAGPEWLR